MKSLLLEQSNSFSLFYHLNRIEILYPTEYKKYNSNIEIEGNSIIESIIDSIIESNGHRTYDDYIRNPYSSG